MSKLRDIASDRDWRCPLAMAPPWPPRTAPRSAYPGPSACPLFRAGFHGPDLRAPSPEAASGCCSIAQDGRLVVLEHRLAALR
eukprot:5983636-Alexandrium_andersonii.AAC.1